MRGVFDDEVQEPVKLKRDTELTLGSGTLLAIFFGLVLLCGLCFGLGYSFGHRGAQPSSAATAVNDASLPPASNGSLSKPSAAPQLITAPAADAAADPNANPDANSATQPPVDPSGTTAAAGAQTLPASVQASPAPGQPTVRPALTPAVVTNESAPSGIRPATASAAAVPAGTLMVQIAAVSNTEDAEVLSNALRRRGYAVTARRDPADNLLHVRIGPFATPAEANSWRMKLLNDGYNAVVQP
jgi:cell division septation protein DedD